MQREIYKAFFIGFGIVAAFSVVFLQFYSELPIDLHLLQFLLLAFVACLNLVYLVIQLMKASPVAGTLLGGAIWIAGFAYLKLVSQLDARIAWAQILLAFVIITAAFHLILQRSARR